MRQFILLLLLLGLPAKAQEVIFEDGFENHSPVIISTPLTEGQVAVAYSYQVDATDIDGDELFFLLTTAPDGMQIGGATGAITWTPESVGVFPATVGVSDGLGGYGSQSWSITVTDPDGDADGLPDMEEARHGTDPADPDSDDDGLLDGEEVFIHETDPLHSDTDRDGLADGQEVDVHYTKPVDPDTDDDGFGDGTEIEAGTDPLDENDFPAGPPDPLAVAPAIDGTVVTSIFDATEFLYNGNPPIQTGVEQDAIDPERASVVRGTVTTREGDALPGVTVSVGEHPEYGQTVTRVNGGYDLVVNGGALLDLEFRKTGLLPAQRQLQVPWRDYLQVPDLAMIPLDEHVTTFEFDAGALAVAQGSEITDADGTRQATLMSPPGTSAELVFPDGSSQPINTLNIRATEYTVGDRGLHAMPAQLPPSSGYTYAVELSADEAIAAGAGDVQFNQPMPFYIENFLGVPTGTDVPMGFLDTATNSWVAAQDGRVIDIVALSGDMAELDSDGDALADEEGKLAALGITDDERRQLAVLYPVGQSLWRVPVSHFTPWDPNFPYSPPADAKEPRVPKPAVDQTEVPEKDKCNQSGSSFVNLQDQVLGEAVEIVGTDLELAYNSSRVPGRKAAFSARIILSDEDIPQSLERIDLEIQVAGQVHTQSFLPSANLSHIFVWDGLDAFGRAVQGEQPVVIRIGYVYPAVYQQPASSEQSFGQTSGIPLEGVDARQKAIIWQEQHTSLGVFDARAAGLGGWTLEVHHAFNPRTLTLYLGDGRRRSASTLNKVIETVTDLSIPFPSEASGPDGEVYFVDEFNHVVARADPDGTQTVIAGNGSPGFSGDGGPASAAQLDRPTDLTVSASGEIYIADYGNGRVRHIDRNGIIRTVAGGGTPADGLGDDGPGVSARLLEPGSVELAPDGTLYIADEAGARIRRLAVNGSINTLAGDGTPAHYGDGGPAATAGIGVVTDLAMGPDGSVYLAEPDASVIRRVGVDGIIERIAGTGDPGYSGDGGPATSAQLNDPEAVAVGLDGTVYIADTGNAALRQIDAQGIMQTIAGTGIPGTLGDGGPAAYAQLEMPVGVGVGPDGSVFITDAGSDDVRRIGLQLPGFTANEIVVPSQDSSQVFIFDMEGRHLRTLRAVNGATLFEFRYDSNGLLGEVEDGDGNVISIERLASGAPTAIISPYNQRTTLLLNSEGYLQKIANPAAEAYRFSYTTGGLLTEVRDPILHSSGYEYDDAGRLTRTLDASGVQQSYVREELADGHRVRQLTGEGREFSYQVRRLSNGESELTNVLPDGLRSIVQLDRDGVQTVTLPRGVTIRNEFGPDPRFGMQAPVPRRSTFSTPGGINVEKLATREVLLTDPEDPLSVDQLMETLSINGEEYLSVYDRGSATVTLTSPAGRPYVATEDPQGRVVHLAIDGVDPVSLNYDLRGQLNTIVHGTGPGSRETSFSYQDGGANLATITDPEQRVLSYSDFDGAGRVHTITLPNGEAVTMTYDARGRIITLVPPGRSDHGFAYTPFGAMTRYDPPVLPDTAAPLSITYDRDRFLDLANYPDGSSINPVYAPVEGQLTGVLAPGADLSLSWYPTLHPSQGAVETIDYANETQVTFSYDGSLLLSTVWSGAVSGSHEQSFDDNLRVQQDSVNSAHPVSYSYDSDGLLIQAGALELRRDELLGAPRNGSLTGTVLGFVVTEQSYNAFGELETFAARFDTGVLNELLYSFMFERDRSGRITRQTEVMPSGTTVIRYEYDLAGQLERVFADDLLLRSYQYDANGNRLIRASVQETDAEYDAQDRLLRAGDRHYQYDANGTLTIASEGNDTTAYTQDIHGNLKAVLLPDGSSIDYSIDGLNRRVGKAVNGATVRQWLYRDNFRLAAELDAAGQVDARFVYATQPNVPDYLERGGQKYRILTDHLGSPRLVVNAATGEIVQQMAFDEFGQLLQDSNPGFQPFGFAGGQQDPDTGLVRFGARDYDPEVGRFISKDRALFAGGSTNLYRYANNDPVNFVDISGFKPGLKSQIDNALAWQWIEDELGLEDATSLGEVADRFRKALEKLGSQSAACRLLVEPIKDTLGIESVKSWESVVEQLKNEDMIGIFDQNGCPRKDGGARVQKRLQEWAKRESECREALGL